MTWRHILKLLGLAVLYMIVNVGASILLVAVYAYAINPGQTPEFYQQFAEASAPYSTIFVGAPLIFGLGWWIARRWPDDLATKSAIGIWVIYAVMDLAITGSVGMTRRLAIFTAISLVTKFVAILLGARVGSHRSTDPG
ncbi:MAG: hypothetical protein HKN43_04370 [Rhodothermales bacterium]|nr:hypothetical protein [Rhodothermales bacterium]